MNTLLVVNALFYTKDGMTQRDICVRTFQSKQMANLIIRNLLSEAYVTVEESKENKRKNWCRRPMRAGPIVKRWSATALPHMTVGGWSSVFCPNCQKGSK